MNTSTPHLAVVVRHRTYVIRDALIAEFAVFISPSALVCVGLSGRLQGSDQRTGNRVHSMTRVGGGGLTVWACDKHSVASST